MIIIYLNNVEFGTKQFYECSETSHNDNKISKLTCALTLSKLVVSSLIIAVVISYRRISREE